MYQCLCGGSYKLPQVADGAIGLVTEDNPVVEIVIRCPHCKEKGIKGGEHTWDEYEDGENAIMLFGIIYDEQKHKQEIIKINNDGSLLVKHPIFIGIPVKKPPKLKPWYQWYLI